VKPYFTETTQREPPRSAAGQDELSSLTRWDFLCYEYRMVTTLHSSSPCQKSVETSFWEKHFLTEQSYPWWCTHRATATGGIKFSFRLFSIY
jgi:hypothetical protein